MTHRFDSGLIAAVALATITIVAAQSNPRFGPGARVLVDAHNSYPTDGKYQDRIDRALGTGLPVAIEMDPYWYVDPRTGIGRSVVSHNREDASTNPTLEEYFFSRVKPIMEKALAENRRDQWPLVVLNLDLKTNEPDHHAAIWALLGKYEAWLTTSGRTASGAPAPLKVGPMMVLTGSNNAQQIAFHDNVPLGTRLRVFGAINQAGPADRSTPRSLVAVTDLIPSSATNYRRWVNFAWAAVEPGPAGAGEWRPESKARLQALVDRAHAMNLWIRFFTLNGHSADNNHGWTASYNFGSPDAAAIRWRAAAEAGVDFIASDMYEDLARVKTQTLARR